CCITLLALTAFPTRRSSDLRRIAASGIQRHGRRWAARAGRYAGNRRVGQLPDGGRLQDPGWAKAAVDAGAVENALRPAAARPTLPRDGARAVADPAARGESPGAARPGWPPAVRAGRGAGPARSPGR